MNLHTSSPALPKLHGSGDFFARTQSALTWQRALCLNPGQVADDVLQDLLDQARSTAFGRQHHLGSVATSGQWKRALPIRAYEGFRPYVERQLAGEPQVLTRSAPYAFLKTSGSSGLPKYVPSTRHWRDHYRGRGLYAQWGLYFEKVGRPRPFSSGLLDLSWERAPVAVEHQGFPVYSISRRPGAVGAEDWVPPWYDTPWFTGDDDEEYGDSLYRKLRLLVGGDVRLLVTLNPSKIVGLAEQLAARGTELVRDVHEGTVAGRAFQGASADPELARRIQLMLDRGDAGLRLTDLWPNLSLVVCWNSASAGLYRDWLENVTPGIPKLPFSTTGTEGIVTLPVDDHPSAGPLAVDQGWYEFAPYEDGDDGGPLASDAETVDFHEVEVGRSYRLVMSQANGLYRYDIGDVYKVVGKVGAVPRLEFSGRAGFASSFTGEKLTETHIHDSLRLAFAPAWGALPLFTCIPSWGTPPGYVIAVEWPEGLGAVAEAELAVGAERALQRLNSEYAEKRRTDRLTPLRVLPLVAGSFGLIAEEQRRRGAAAMQIKHHWIQRNDALLDIVTEMGLTVRR
ncbi:GH3 auxin-responsive promoter family protein [Streptomyces sp. NBC_00448]|uniref:GH3 auxin-responsive promoter family protein n=1 Tax=Streptomyces sp. NBC_00448 TaxID=2903652 RepID=UPI002E203829